MKIQKLIREGAPIIDVRSPMEFMSGHVEGSINIPLHEVPSRIQELKAMGSPLVLCCASGNRSGQASYFLQQQGIECINAGSWTEVNYHKYAS